MDERIQKNSKLETKQENTVSEIPISQYIFSKFFENLKEKCAIDKNIISRMKKLFEENKLANPIELDNFVKWLEEYNAKDKETKS